MINWNDEKIYKLHNSTGSCVTADIISTKGLVDFYVNDSQKWAVEILQDSGSVKGHVLRFGPGGLHSIVPISEKVILYFMAKKGTPKTVVVWYIQHARFQLC
jgi:hypothetical protein